MLPEVILSGDERALRNLQALAARADDLRPGWEKVLGALRREEITIFGTRGYGKWPANAKSTAARKGGDTPLIDQGWLNHALTREHARGAVARRSKTRAVFGVNDRGKLFYSRFVGKRRPFIVPDERADRIAVRTLLEHLSGTVSTRGPVVFNA